jgi:class 3 adenylate cyclase/tetratricopeptide (TPR) repeat protein
MEQIADWLKKLGMSEYAARFAENDIDIDVLSELTDQDLEKLGVSLGHRRKMLRAIRDLGGASVAATAPSSPAATEPTRREEAERRQLTVMFTDLVGSTALSAKLDPEDLRFVIGAYHKCVAETIARFDGFVAKYMGDGVLIYFGYPQAHEDDAERAVRAGLTLTDAVGKLRIQAPLQARIGIATGLVVVGDIVGSGEAQERGVVGETPNLAARLQALARPGTLLIADATRQLIGELFDLVDLGPQALAGFAGSQRAWRVVSESAVLSRFEALRSGAAPLVGRGEEIDLLKRRWEQAKAGEGRVVLISGEPGIGKSRLTAALSEMIAGETHTRLRYFCSPHCQDSALHPFINQLERAAGFTREDTPERKRSKLQGLVAGDIRRGEDLILIEELLSLPNTAAELNLSPQKKREKVFESLLWQLEAIARRTPVLFVFEDAHWSDPTSREILDLAIDRVLRLSVLVVITFRPEFRPPWAGQPHVTMLALNRLSGRDVAALVKGLAGNALLGSEVIEEIVERTDGVPLFVEELTKAVIESGNTRDRVEALLAASPGAMLAIPATLHASLISRLDRLGTVAREVAQIGAVLGRDFSYEMIEPVTQRRAAELQAALQDLTEAGLLFCRGTAPHSSYLFKHALVQDAAYGTLLRDTRRRMHAQIAAMIEGRYPAVLDAEPELLARHYTEAGDSKKALVYWLRAGQRAARRSTNTEALRHFARGLELLKAVPDTPEARQMEIQFLTSRAVVLRIAKGYGADELLGVLERARDLCRRYGDSCQMFQILFGIWTAQAGRGDWPRCRQLGEECLVIAERENDTGLLIEAHRLLGSTATYMGKCQLAVQHLQQALHLYDPEKHQANTFLYGFDPGTICNGYISWPLWLQGDVKNAFAASSASIRLAIASKHPSNLALAYVWAMFLHLCAQDIAALRPIIRKLITLCEESGFPHFLAFAKIGHGWCLSHTGQSREGLEWLWTGIDEFRASWGGGFLFPEWLICLADALRVEGQFAEAKAALDRSRDMIERGEERLWEAENYRVRGEVAQEEGDSSAAFSAFETAIMVAKRQFARSLELRASLAWARLAAHEGRREEARDRLASICSSFTEGFGTLDMKEAKALLEQIKA